MISAWAAAAREPGASAVRFMRIGCRWRSKEDIDCAQSEDPSSDFH